VGLFARRSAKAQDPEFDAFEQVASQVIDVIASAGAVLDQSNMVLRASPGAVQFGLVNGKRLAHQPLVDLVNRARKTNGAVSIDDARGPIGKGKRELQITATLISPDGSVLILVDDEGEKQRVDAVRRDFITNISHELKTPIQALTLNSDAIAGAKGDPVAIEKFAESLQKESQRLANIVQELIQLSRVQGAKLSETIEEIDLATVIADAVDRNQTLANQRGVKLASTADVSVKIQGDYEMLVTAVRNLIENAIVYSEPNSQVGVGLRVVDDVAEISVTDSGLGIPESEQERIFERFYRVDPSRSRETGGTGLGLSIVKHAAFHHRGEIKLFSKPGVGSTFTLRLPINKKEEIQ